VPHEALPMPCYSRRDGRTPSSLLVTRRPSPSSWDAARTPGTGRYVTVIDSAVGRLW